MNKLEQKTFVLELGMSVIQEMMETIGKGKVPENWDGVELREWMAERFNQARLGGMSRGRKAKYNNDIMVNNL